MTATLAANCFVVEKVIGFYFEARSFITFHDMFVSVCVRVHTRACVYVTHRCGDWIFLLCSRDQGGSPHVLAALCAIITVL